MPPLVVPLVMKMRTDSSAGRQLSVRSLKALIGTAGMSRQLLTPRGVRPRCMAKRR